MKKLIVCVLALGILAAGWCLPTAGSAVQITPITVSGTGTFYGAALSTLADDVFAPEWGQWQTGTVWWHGTGPAFTFDLGGAFYIEDINVSVDNNDTYKIDYSIDNVNWFNLITISSGYGEVGSGMDTFSTMLGNAEYLAALDFGSVSAQYLRLYAIGGDNSYSTSELQAFGYAPAVPIPAAVWLLGSGLAGLFGLRRKLFK